MFEELNKIIVKIFFKLAIKHIIKNVIGQTMLNGDWLNFVRTENNVRGKHDMLK